MSKPPIFLNLLKIQLPIAGVSSILHRISAVGIFVLLLPFSVVLVLASNSEEGFSTASYLLSFNSIKVLLVLLLTGLTYHYISGIRHLVMDFGYWQTLNAGKISAILTIVLSGLISLILLVVVW
ncbi:MAG: succinate dehydrogenase, cytochrome b556 subunit [Gammaproteobacteria bacterium]|jgi:succinate dehydrogenase / fumarate reductase cytochrome b subunit|tara:strand:- start:482 stop:853 length:372 start_codon:yes stop_codon:yes gene_type:complete